MPASAPAAEEVHRFLSHVHGVPVRDLEPLSGGFWSSAFAYRVADDELVARFGTIRSGFEADRAAMVYATEDLPVPEVIDIGEAFGGAYAISRRHHGRFLEDLAPEEAPSARPMIHRLLTALRTTRPLDDVDAGSWRQWLLDSMGDSPQHPTSGWRVKLEAHAPADRLFRRIEKRVHELAPACPERRDLVHGDLLHRNVLVSADASRVTAVFSWKCALPGDFLFDTAWCTFWGATFHPGIAALDVWSLVAGDRSIDDGALADAALRHHCYELHIGATHLGWYAWTGDVESLQRVATHAAMLLERGPESLPVT